jgi:hypothetical protein
MLQEVHPQPIRTTPDNRFAADTMTRRLPANIRNVIASNPEYPPSVRRDLDALAEAILGNALIPRLPLPAWDYDRWLPVYEEHAGERWHDTQWFFGETYGFRLLLSAARYFETLTDPFGAIKRNELESAAPFLPLQRFAESPAREVARVEEALHLSMWGNRADISFTAGGALDHSAGDSQLLLVDDSAPAAQLLSAATGPIHIVMDNSGAELAGDLVLATTLVDTLNTTVVLHPKLYPTYVSDTTVEDIHTFIEAARRSDDAAVLRMADAVAERIDSGLIRIAPDDYWCGVRFLSEMPPRIAAALDGAGAVIIKGDFNYRRVFRDTIWAGGTDPVAAMGVELPYPVVLLRTMKSDCLVGVDTTITAALDETEPGWRTAGKRGLIQLVPGR